MRKGRLEIGRGEREGRESRPRQKRIGARGREAKGFTGRTGKGTGDFGGLGLSGVRKGTPHAARSRW